MAIKISLSSPLPTSPTPPPPTLESAMLFWSQNDQCPCPSSHPYPVSDAECIDTAGDTVSRMNGNSYSPLFLNDGSLSTSWKSANGVDRAVIDFNFLGLYELFSIDILFLSDLPYSVIIEKLYQGTNSPIHYFSSDCMGEFGLQPNAPSLAASSPSCSSIGSSPSNLSFVLFNLNEHPEQFENSSLLSFSLLDGIRITLQNFSISHPATIAFPGPDQYFLISEVIVSGRVYCSGHGSTSYEAYNWPTDAYLYRCSCHDFTTGFDCGACQSLYNNRAWQAGTYQQANPCQECNCYNHSTNCVFNPIAGFGVCLNCTDHTTGINCDTCSTGYFRAIGVSQSVPSPCQPCQCNPAGVTSAICTPDVFASLSAPGTCLCKPSVGGAACDTCLAGYTNLTAGNENGCSSCSCDALGSVQNSTCDPITGQCVCKANVIGKTCDTCSLGTHTLGDSGCLSCNCSAYGSTSATCNPGSGACACLPTWSGDKCDQCSVTLVQSLSSIGSVPICTSCGCNLVGSSSLACSNTGACMCSSGFTGADCSQCAPFFTKSMDSFCDGFSLDVVFLVQASSSLPSSTFAEEIDAAASAVAFFQSLTMPPRLALLTYADNASVIFGYGSNLTTIQMIDSISRLAMSTSSSAANLGVALSYIHSTLLTSSPALVVVFAGSSSPSDDPTSISAAIKQAGSYLFIASPSFSYSSYVSSPSAVYSASPVRDTYQALRRVVNASSCPVSLCKPVFEVKEKGFTRRIMPSF